MNRKAADRILRMLLLSTLIGVVMIVVAAIVVADHRGLLLAIGAVYLVTSLAAYFTLRRSIERELARQSGQAPPSG
jgi:uncharacterized membrane protein YqjE